MRSIYKKPVSKQETISEMEYRLRQEAKELAEKNKNKKATKYDLKSWKKNLQSKLASSIFFVATVSPVIDKDFPFSAIFKP